MSTFFIRNFFNFIIPHKGGARLDMLNGPLSGRILLFAFPLMLSGIMQQSFNSIDVAVAGRYCSQAALAAVGSNGVVISLLVNLFLGLSVGANVLIAQHIGARRFRETKEAVATVMSLSIICGIILAITGWIFSRPILEMMSTPEDVLDPATVYLKLYFLGVPFMLIYNFGAAVLRSVGDTGRPFYCLLAGGIVNVGANLLLVIWAGMDVAGVAVATVLSNVISAWLLIRIMIKEKDPVKLELNKLHISRRQFAGMTRIGLPAGIQGVVFPLSNVFVVSGINVFGAAGSAGSGAAINYEYYCYYVIAAFINAAVAFTGQNYGAGKFLRCNRVFALCMLLAMGSCAALNLGIAWQKEFFISIFTSEPEVVFYAYKRIEAVLVFQWIAVSYEIAGACLRGLGYSMTPMVITIIGTCAVRMLWVTSFHNGDLIQGFEGLLSVYPVTWILTGSAVLAAYFIIRPKAYREAPEIIGADDAVGDVSGSPEMLENSRVN